MSNPGGGGGSNPCTAGSPGSGYGDPVGWPNTAGYTVVTEIDNIAVNLNQNQWVYTGITLQPGQGLAVQSSGQGIWNGGSCPYSYPEGPYANTSQGCGVGGQHFGYDPSQVVQLFSSACAVSNRPAQSLVLAITASSATPPATTSSSHLAPPAINYGLVPPAGQGMRSALFAPASCNNGMGGAVWVIFNDSDYIDNICTFLMSLQVVAVQIAVDPPANFTFTAVAQQIAGTCSALLTIQLYDQNGVVANVPAGQSQVFTLTDGTGGSFSPSNLVTIGAGQNSATVTYTNVTSGTFPVTATPGAGPLAGSAAQTVLAIITCSGSDPIPNICGPTRANLRDAIRRKLGITPPVDEGMGAVGAEPPGQVYPSNPVLNQAIADAIRTINRRCNFHNHTGVPIPVTGQNAANLGPQFISLQGVNTNCASKNVINFVRRVVWFNGTTYTRLLPVSFWEKDRSRVNFDMDPPSTPREYFIEGYQLALLPAAATDGTLYLYVGQAVSTLLSDGDWIDELPIDYAQTIEDLAGWLVCTYMPTGATEAGIPGFADRAPALKLMADAGIDEIQKWFNGISESWQPSLVVDARRRRRVR